MQNSKTNKILTIIGVILLIISIAMIININIPITNKDKVISLIEKTASNNNVYVKMTTTSQGDNLVTESEFFKKDDMQLIKTIGPTVNETVWSNTKNGEITLVDNSSMIAVETNTDNIEKTTNYKYIPSYLKDENTSFKYISQEKYNGIRCIVGEFSFNDKLTGVTYTHKFWIDKKDGTIQKEEFKEVALSGGVIETTTTYETSFDVVKQEDVATPDLSGYTMAKQ